MEHRGTTNTIEIPDVLVSRFAEYLSTSMGLYFPRKRHNELVQKISAAMRDFGFEDGERFVTWLLSGPLTKQQIEVLANQLTVKETYFFRETPAYEALERVVLPGLIDAGRKTQKTIRIWSAGCSTGEEVYSVAILLTRLIPDIEDWNITLLATDIDSRALDTARKGVYSGWSFRSTPPGLRDQYFEEVEGGRFAVRSALKKMVVFSYLNLSEDSYPSLQNNTNAMDVILCRNVLMYFTPDHAREVTRRFHRCLGKRGFLILGIVEASNVLASEFTPVQIGDAILYEKSGSRHRQSAAVEQRTAAGEKPAAHSPVRLRAAHPQRAARPFRRAEQPPAMMQRMSPAYEEALALYKQGLYGEAEEKLTFLVSRDGKDMRSIALLARVLANRGDLAGALHWCEKGIEADRLDAGLYYLRTNILHERGDMEEALASLKKALYLDPDFVMAHFALGNLMLKNGRAAEMKRCFRNVVRLLSKYRPEQELPEADGMTAARLSEILRSMSYLEA